MYAVHDCDPYSLLCPHFLTSPHCPSVSPDLPDPEEARKNDTPPAGSSSSNRDSGSTVSNEYPTIESPHAHTPASGDGTISSVGSSSNRQSTAGSLGSLEDVTLVSDT